MTTDAAQQQQKSAKPPAAPAGKPAGREPGKDGGKEPGKEAGGANYKATLNLPQTAFPMEAKLVQNEPARLAKWKQAHLYDQILRARAGAPKWVLHDGPPFANGDIHIGHLINKTLKDVFIRFKTMQGRQTPYVPGWDCHGLPIEHKIQEALKKEGKHFREVDTVEVRGRRFA